MEGTRLEIFVEGEWKRIQLRDKVSIKYNKLVNKVGKINTREISHTNTFSIIPTYHNRQVLGLNVFNHEQLAKALNSKYEAKYYVEEKIIQEGFVVINQSNDRDIRLNFFDQGLEIIDNWAETSLRGLLNNAALPLPSDYQNAIREMKNYSLPFNQVASILGDVGSRGHKLSLFPNNLNTIGDDFMVDKDGTRRDNTINVYQSRPLFNAKAILDLACYAYDYTPIYDQSVDWEDVDGTYIVPADLSSNFKDEGITITLSTVLNTGNTLLINAASDTYAAIASSSRTQKPGNINGWVSPQAGYSNNYLSEDVVFVPNLDSQPSGFIEYTMKVSAGSSANPEDSYAVWSNQNAGSDVIFVPLFIENISLESSGTLKFSVNKVQLFNQPVNGDQFLGVFTTMQTNGTLSTTQISETFLPIESVNYDDFGQFESQSIDLTYAAPKETLKELVVGILSKNGILMNIDNRKKEILFYNYARYLNQRENLIQTDFTDFLVEAAPINYNTDYGNGFGKLNEIGLSDPFKGNTFFLPLDNQGADSKLKDFERNLLPKFSDVSKIQRIPNSITPYTEYEHEGLGFVKIAGVLGELTQIRFLEPENDGDPLFQTVGVITGLPAVQNVNYADLPSGLSEWYRLVDAAIKANPSFLVPVDVMRNLDLTSPIYIEQMGGYYIIEEVAEYENSQTKVVVKVIKMIDSAEYNDDFSNAFNI